MLVICFRIVCDGIVKLLKMLELFGSVLENFSMDFCGLLLSGKYLFVIIDENICYLIVEVVRLFVVKIVIFVLD